MLTRVCGACGKELELSSEFFPTNRQHPSGFHNTCKDCRRIYNRNWYSKNKEDQKEKRAKYHAANKEAINAYHRGHYDKNKKRYSERNRLNTRKLKVQVINAYGGKCACCGEDRIEFLTIDHINGGGNQHRRRLHANFYIWLRREGWPSEFRCLCMNCNASYGFYGYCPHQIA